MGNKNRNSGNNSGDKGSKNGVGCNDGVGCNNGDGNNNVDDVKLNTQTASSSLAIRYRESIITEVFEKYDLRYVYRSFVSVVGLLYIRTVLKEWDSGDMNSYGFGIFKVGFHDIDYTFKVWLGLVISNLFVHPALCFWAKIRSFLPKTGIILKIWDSSWLLIVFIYMFSIIYLPYYIRGISTAVASNIALIGEQMRLAMKTHGFVRSNVPKFLYDKEDKPISTRMPEFKNYLYYLVAPTLIYQDNYPRTTAIKWKRLRNLILEFFMMVYFLSVIVVELLDSFKDIGLKPQTKISLLLLYIKCVFIGNMLHHLIFYIFLHNWSNMWAELLRFPDRQFYQDWWYQYLAPAFYRKWNTLVYAYIHTYLYKDILKLIKNKLAAVFFVLLLSSILHEHFMYVCSNLFIPTIAVQMIVVTFSVTLLLKRVKLDEAITNYMFIASVSFIKGFDCFIYLFEYYARINCPEDDIWLGKKKSIIFLVDGYSDRYLVKYRSNSFRFMLVVKDWWTTFLAPEFYRKWNILIYAYLHTYLYKDLVKTFKNKLFATFLVVFISGVFHEVALFYSAGIFVPLITIQMLFLSFVLTPLTSTKPVNEMFSSYMLIMTIFIVKGLEVFWFFFEYISRANCPECNNGFLETIYGV